MSLDNFLKATAVAVSRPELAGEPATLWPEAGGSRSIQVVANRLDKVTSEDGEFVIVSASLFIPNDATVGMTSLEDGDELDLALREGGAPSRVRVDSITAQDAGGWLVEVSA